MPLKASVMGATVRTCVRISQSEPRRQPADEEPRVDLTKRQKEIFDFIGRYASKYGYPPTVREIGKAVGLHSSSTVHAHLANLEKSGLLRRDPSKPRAIELLVDKAKKAIRSPGLPLVGQVAAGQPILAEENIEEYLDVPDMIGGEDGDYVLRGRGGGMKDAGRLEDVVLGAWEDLVAGGPAECPVCGGSMRAAGGCRSCGSDLS